MRFKIPYGGMDSKPRKHFGSFYVYEFENYTIQYSVYSNNGVLKVLDKSNEDDPMLMTISDNGFGISLDILTSALNEYHSYSLSRYPLPKSMRSDAPNVVNELAYRIVKDFQERWRDKTSKLIATKNNRKRKREEIAKYEEELVKKFEKTSN